MESDDESDIEDDRLSDAHQKKKDPGAESSLRPRQLFPPDADFSKHDLWEMCSLGESSGTSHILRIHLAGWDSTVKGPTSTISSSLGHIPLDEG